MNMSRAAAECECPLLNLPDGNLVAQGSFASLMFLCRIQNRGIVKLNPQLQPQDAVLKLGVQGKSPS